LRSSRALAIVSFATASLWVQPGLGQRARDVLTVGAPSESDCTSAARLEERVEARVGQGLDGESGRIAIEITGSAVLGWRALLSLRGASGAATGTRTLTTGPGSCAQLDPPMELVISTFVGSTVARARGRDLERPEAPPPRPSAPARPAYPWRRASTRPSAPWRWSGALAGLLASGPLPAPFYGIAAGLDVQRDRFVGRVAALAFPSSRSDLGEGARASFRLFALRLAACGVVARAAAGQLSVCAGARVGPLLSAARGLGRSQDSVNVSIEAELALRHEVWLGTYGGGYLGVSASIPLRSTAFYFVERDGSNREYHRTNPGVTGELGVILRLGL
jgi:hypothetical protein